MVNPTLGLAGILLNIINMIVFYKMGLSDRVTQNFFILSFSDFLLSATLSVNKFMLMLRAVIIAYIGYGGVEQVVHIKEMVIVLLRHFKQTQDFTSFPRQATKANSTHISEQYSIAAC